MKNTIRLFAVLALLSISIVSVAQEKKAKKEMPPLEKMPQFPGGEKAMVDFINGNLKYPLIWEKQRMKMGKVSVRFVVSETGKLTNISVTKGIGIEYDREAMRVIKLMPDWSPGIADGKPVSVPLSIPILFKHTEQHK